MYVRAIGSCSVVRMVAKNTQTAHSLSWALWPKHAATDPAEAGVWPLTLGPKVHGKYEKKKICKIRSQKIILCKILPIFLSSDLLCHQFVSYYH